MRDRGLIASRPGGYAHGVTERTTLIVAAGEVPIPAAWADQADLVIAADSGLANVMAHDVAADLVIGDMDSVDPALLVAAEAAGTIIERHPGGKDESDLELALAAASKRGTGETFVVVRDGGRLDHAVANLAVLASPRWAAMKIDALVGTSRVWPIHGARSLPLDVGDHLSLHAVGGAAEGVTSTGVRYPLTGERLDPFGARGIANIVDVADPVVRVESGVVLAISSPTRH